MYEPEAENLLAHIGLSISDGGGSAEGDADKVVPAEGVQALSAAMSLLGGNSGVFTEVREGRERENVKRQPREQRRCCCRGVCCWPESVYVLLALSLSGVCVVAWSIIL